jgi:hypothetical protein
MWNLTTEGNAIILFENIDKTSNLDFQFPPQDKGTFLTSMSVGFRSSAGPHLIVGK